MIVLGFDTATRSTAVALSLDGGEALRARDDPGPEEHPGHATRLLAMAGELLQRAGVGWRDVERIAVGLGPGTFTGLRVGVATARGLAQSLSCELVGVSSSLALATAAAGTASDAPGAQTEGRVLAVIDARRGEVFASAYRHYGSQPLVELVPPSAVAPAQLAGVIALAEERGSGAGTWLTVGDGAVRHRRELEGLALTIPADSAGVHLLDAATICRLGLTELPLGPLEQLLPDYRRRPDAELALEALAAPGGVAP
ncbi:MAG TPA: tRNA (adenosine(37)-N6)-threonylcarbamoyltransferase complex dimerization subunit type 1 TsaB [Solirubrobacteraceae bacterium]|jgi:tRNA threonylcarbamoyladenosine biosynthesis protein TsaB|nr:tRNA (adenosine(37)-N6)-threonylcarbamoyltransferase complex dimerization subunit type 1 TsaB [Solirubrobacteraceae bacterium]